MERALLRAEGWQEGREEQKEMEAQGEGVGGREGQRTERKGREVIPFPVQLLISANGTEKPGLLMFLFNPCFVNAADTPQVLEWSGSWQETDGSSQKGPWRRVYLGVHLRSCGQLEEGIVRAGDALWAWWGTPTASRSEGGVKGGSWNPEKELCWCWWQLWTQ